MRNFRHTSLQSRNGQKINSGAFFSFLSIVLSIHPDDLEQVIQQEQFLGWNLLPQQESSAINICSYICRAAVDFFFFFSSLSLQRKSCSNYKQGCLEEHASDPSSLNQQESLVETKTRLHYLYSISAAVDFFFFSFLRLQRKSCSNVKQGYHSRNTQQCSNLSSLNQQESLVEILHLT